MPLYDDQYDESQDFGETIDSGGEDTTTDADMPGEDMGTDTTDEERDPKGFGERLGDDDTTLAEQQATSDGGDDMGGDTTTSDERADDEL